MVNTIHKKKTRPVKKKARKKATKKGNRLKNSRDNNSKRILFAASEVYPLIKTGGLADVACYLPIALHEMRHDIRIIMPAYRSVVSQAMNIKSCKGFYIPEIDVHFRLLQTSLPDSDVIVYLVDVPQLFDRPGGPYQDASGMDWPDNAQRFALFCRVIQLVSLDQAGLHWQPDILHCNDWHTGLAPALLASNKNRPAVVFTIHNLAYQGDYSFDIYRSLKLPDYFWSPESLEFYGRLSFIKGGLVYADRLIAVSPEYAREITTQEYGFGLEGLLSRRRKCLSGILNGVDYRFWDPRHDPMIKRHYWLSNIKDKRTNKHSLQQELGLNENNDAVLLAHICRLTWQKGIDLILDAIPALLQDENVQLVVLGTGEAHYEQALHAASESYDGRIAAKLEYDEILAHRLQAAADMMLMPSRYEPCGLTQLYSLRYGTIPIVRKTGGLADTVVAVNEVTLADKTATGFQFVDSTASSFVTAVYEALSLYRLRARWQRIMRTAMKQDFSWSYSAVEYSSLYEELFRERS